MITEEIDTMLAENIGSLQTRDSENTGVAVVDDQGDIRYLNSAWKHLLGGRNAEALHIGNNYLQVLNAVFDPETRTYLEAIEHGLHMVLQGQRESVELEYPHECIGYWRWFLIRMTAHTVHGARVVLIEQSDITHALRSRAVGG